MGRIMEGVFCIAYLVYTGALGIIMVKSGRKQEQRWFFGILTLVLVGGDAFHLVPRIYGAFTNTMDALYAPLGFGTLVTSVTMTIFYVLLWGFWQRRVALKGKEGPSPRATATVYALAIVRILLCFFPQNDWFSAQPPLSWGIYRNIPFVLLGAMVIYRLYRDRKIEYAFKYAWLSVLLSFLFYMPVVLFAGAIPIMGMFMIPKTICYVWLILMGYKATKIIG